VAQVSFVSDLKLAMARRVDLARKDEGVAAPGVENARRVVDSWKAAADKATRKGSDYWPSVPQGMRPDVDIRSAENNGDASIRNVEHTLLQLVRGAQRSVRMYNMLAYNPGVAQAVADAVGRLGAKNVRILVDQALTFTPNLVFREMVKHEVQRMLNDPRAGFDDEYKARLLRWEEVFRWRINLASKHFDKSAGAPANEKDRIDIDQQQHTKTVIIDADPGVVSPGAILFVGSANFDLITFGGAFREFSVAARTTAPAGMGVEQVNTASAVFDAIWANQNEAVTTKALLNGKMARKEKLPNDEVIRAARSVMTIEYTKRQGLMPLDIREPGKCR
jgi:phosphatidylserine/phosphatidylglycerophosphate/cardiolipin synthase-like enzyme